MFVTHQTGYNRLTELNSQGEVNKRKAGLMRTTVNRPGWIRSGNPDAVDSVFWNYNPSGGGRGTDIGGVQITPSAVLASRVIDGYRRQPRHFKCLDAALDWIEENTGK